MEEVLVYHEHLIANVEPTECFPLVENVAKGIVEWQKSWLQERERAEGFFFPFSCWVFICRQFSVDSALRFVLRMQGISIAATYVCLSSSCSSRLSPKNKGTFAPQFGNLSAWWMTTKLVAERISPIASLAANQETVSKTESEVEVMVEEDEIRPIILPTNESSENLLKIRHTVRKSCCTFLQLLSSSSSISKEKEGPVLTF